MGVSPQRAGLRIATAVAIVLLGLPIANTQASACGRLGKLCEVPGIEVGRDGIGYEYDSVTKTLHPDEFEVTGEETTNKGTTWETKYVRTCDNFSSDSELSSCGDVGCTANGVESYLTTVMRRETASHPWEEWPNRGEECAPAEPGQGPISMRQVEISITQIIEDHYSRISRPKIKVEPSPTAIVNLPVIASTPHQGSVGFDIQEPIPGRVEASPTYSWSWSNGAHSSGPGRAYDGTNPSTNTGHYPVSATYSNAGGGSVTLTATWHLTLSLAGMDPIADIEPLVYEETASFNVRNAKTVLVD